MRGSTFRYVGLLAFSLLLVCGLVPSKAFATELYFEGWESYSAGAWSLPSGWTSSNTWNVDTATPYDGTKYLNPSSGNALLYYTSPFEMGSLDRVVVGFAFRSGDNSVGTEETLMAIANTTGDINSPDIVCQLNRTTGEDIVLTGSNGIPQEIMSDVDFGINTWYYFEIEIIDSPSTDACAARVDGGDWSPYSAIDTGSGDTQFGVNTQDLYIRRYSSDSSPIWDNLRISDDALGEASFEYDGINEGAFTATYPALNQQSVVYATTTLSYASSTQSIDSDVWVDGARVEFIASYYGSNDSGYSGIRYVKETYEVDDGLTTANSDNFIGSSSLIPGIYQATFKLQVPSISLFGVAFSYRTIDTESGYFVVVVPGGTVADLPDWGQNYIDAVDQTGDNTPGGILPDFGEWGEMATGTASTDDFYGVGEIIASKFPFNWVVYYGSIITSLHLQEDAEAIPTATLDFASTTSMLHNNLDTTGIDLEITVFDPAVFDEIAEIPAVLAMRTLAEWATWLMLIGMVIKEVAGMFSRRTA